MKRRHRHVGLAVTLLLPLVGCAAEEEPAKPGGAKDAGMKGQQESAPAPETPADFLALAEKAMAKEGAWTFAVQGEERLTLQGQENTATFEATVRRSQEPEALHSEGVVTSGEGATETAEIYVLGGTAYLRQGEESWKRGPASEPGTRNKIEDPVAALEQFGDYVQEPGDGVTLKRTDGTIRLRVAVDDAQKLSEVEGRGYVAKAIREFQPTAKQLREAGVPVNEAELTVAGLEETLVLDAGTYRIKSHRFRFELLIPYGGDDIAYAQDVREENQGVFDGKIRLPEGVG